MFTFKSVKNGKVFNFEVSIEKRTRLLVIEKKEDGEQYGKYVRLTCQQIDKIKSMALFGGQFSSATIPVNVFKFHGGVLTIVCREDNQVVAMDMEDVSHLFNYYEKHRDHIARFDKQFRSYR